MKLTALEVIVLDANQIETIQSDTFDHTTNLRELILGFNKISFFNEDILLPIQNLEILYISSNLLKNNLPIFKNCSKLKEISLSKNGIIEIWKDIFVNCVNLEVIDFNSNDIEYLNTDIFLNKPNLSYVDLRVNRCIDKEFIGSSGTKFSTDEYNAMMNEISVCDDGRTTTTFMPTLP